MNTIEDYDQIMVDASVVDIFIEEVQDLLNQSENSLLELEHHPENKDAVNQLLRCLHTIKSPAAVLGYRHIQLISHQMESLLIHVRRGKLSINSSLADFIFLGLFFLKDLLSVLKRGRNDRDRILAGFNHYDPLPYAKGIALILKYYSTRTLDSILSALPDQEKYPFKALRWQKKRDLKGYTLSGKSDLPGEQSRQKDSQVRVSSQRLNPLVDWVGELVVQQSILKEYICRGQTERLKDSLDRLDVIISSVRNLVMEMRMAPLGDLFSKVRVAIRNKARKVDKNIHFYGLGESLEMDRQMIEKIQPLIIRLMEEMAAEGIESLQERTRLGKSPEGHLRIEAGKCNNRIRLLLVHDGAAFMPGLEDLDLVVKSLNGSSHIAALSDQGGELEILLPLRISTVDGLITSVKDEFYIFPFESIEGLLHGSQLRAVASEAGPTIMDTRDGYFVMVDFYPLLTAEKRDLPESAIYLKVRAGGEIFLFPVDRIVGRQDLVIKEIPGQIQANQMISSGTIFGDGNIGFILDPEAIILYYYSFL